MKTKIFKPVAIVALSIVSLTIVAQNITNAQANKKSDLLASTGEMLALADASKDEPSEASTFDYVLNEFENVVKYNPESSIVNTYDNEVILEEVTEEMKSYLKYNPAESMVDPQNEISADLTKVLDELSKVVKYNPSDLY